MDFFTCHVICNILKNKEAENKVFISKKKGLNTEDLQALSNIKNRHEAVNCCTGL